MTNFSVLPGKNTGPEITSGAELSALWSIVLRDRGRTFTPAWVAGAAKPAGSQPVAWATNLADGRVFLTPYDSANYGYWNPSTRTYTPAGAHGLGPTPFFFAVAMGAAQALMVPESVDRFYIWDAVTDRARPSAPHGLIGASPLGAPVRALDGRIYLAPGAGQNVITVLDPVTERVSYIPFPITAVQRYVVAQLLLDGRIYFAAAGNGTTYVFDPALGAAGFSVVDGATWAPVVQSGSNWAFFPNGSCTIPPGNTDKLYGYSALSRWQGNGGVGASIQQFATPENANGWAGLATMMDGSAVLCPYSQSGGLLAVKPGSAVMPLGISPTSPATGNKFKFALSTVTGDVLFVPRSAANWGTLTGFSGMSSDAMVAWAKIITSRWYN